MRENYLALIALIAASKVFTIANGDNVQIPTQCPEKDSGNATIRLKHESDCSKYYECLQGDKTLQICPYRNEYGDRLHFNPALQSCAWPDLAVCKDANFKLPHVCPKNLRHCVRIPHETQCDRFYLCDYDREVEMKCADGLHFNPITQMCDYQKHTGCDITCVWKCCPPKGSDIELWLPHECSCSKYYECEDGEQVVRYCPKDQHFDEWLRRCRSINDAGCVVRSTNDVKCPKDTTEVVNIAHESDCDKYYRCVSGKMILRKCPPERSFNPSLGVCDFPENIPCNVSPCCSPETRKVPTLKSPNENHVDVLHSSKKDSDCLAEGIVKLPFPTNCTLYYFCKNGWKTMEKCPMGLYFNPAIMECDWPLNEIVCNPPPADLALLRSGVPASTDSQGDLKTVCYGKCPLVDPKDKTVHLPTDDCTMFCKCSKGVPYPMKCSKGLRYDKKEQVCNWSWAVKCENDLAKDANPADES